MNLGGIKHQVIKTLQCNVTKNQYNYTAKKEVEEIFSTNDEETTCSKRHFKGLLIEIKKLKRMHMSTPLTDKE